MPGYDCQLRNMGCNTDRLRCKQCTLLLKEPLQHCDNGVLVCSSCLPDYKMRIQTLRSDDARLTDSAVTDDGMDDEWRYDRAKHKEVMELMVICNNGVHGCRWQGTVECLEKHMKDDCQHNSATGLNSRDEKLEEMQKDLEECKMRLHEVEQLVNHHIHEQQRLITKLVFQQDLHHLDSDSEELYLSATLTDEKINSVQESYGQEQEVNQALVVPKIVKKFVGEGISVAKYHSDGRGVEVCDGTGDHNACDSNTADQDESTTQATHPDKIDLNSAIASCKTAMDATTSAIHKTKAKSAEFNMEAEVLKEQLSVASMNHVSKPIVHRIQ